MKTAPTICPECGIEVEILPASHGMKGYSCPSCGKVGVLRASVGRASGRVQQLKLFGIERGKPTCMIEQAEEDVQRQTIAALGYKGYIVLQTTVKYHWQKCPHCKRKHRPEGGYGATLGVPDLLVTHIRWREGEGLFIEMKGTKTPLSDAQTDLQAKGRIVVCHSMEEALRAVSIYDYARTVCP
jgi:predicted RNA-binding Zn-ribbon protein involved in translation (DUF1610 family)